MHYLLTFSWIIMDNLEAGMGGVILRKHLYASIHSDAPICPNTPYIVIQVYEAFARQRYVPDKTHSRRLSALW